MSCSVFAFSNSPLMKFAMSPIRFGAMVFCDLGIVSNFDKNHQTSQVLLTVQRDFTDTRTSETVTEREGINFSPVSSKESYSRGENWSAQIHTWKSQRNFINSVHFHHDLSKHFEKPKIIIHDHTWTNDQLWCNQTELKCKKSIIQAFLPQVRAEGIKHKPSIFPCVSKQISTSSTSAMVSHEKTLPQNLYWPLSSHHTRFGFHVFSSVIPSDKALILSFQETSSLFCSPPSHLLLVGIARLWSGLLRWVWDPLTPRLSDHLHTSGLCNPLTVVEVKIQPLHQNQELVDITVPIRRLVGS